MKPIPEHQSSYIDNYDEHNSEKTLAGFFLQKSHTILEDIFPNSISVKRILEVGAGTGHHVKYVKHDFEEYIMSDQSTKMLKIAEKKFNEEIISGRIKLENEDTRNLSFADNSFDRLIATHVLEHLSDPVQILTEWNRVVKSGGVISIILPCDPGMLWRFGRYLGPRAASKKSGINYDYLMAIEHINSIFNLVVLIKHHFDVICDKWYPAMLPIPDLNLFYVCHLKVNKEKEADVAKD